MPFLSNETNSHLWNESNKMMEREKREREKTTDDDVKKRHSIAFLILSKRGMTLHLLSVLQNSSLFPASIRCSFTLSSLAFPAFDSACLLCLSSVSLFRWFDL